MVRLLDVGDLRRSGAGEEEVAEAAFQALDDQPWPPASARPMDQSWADHEVTRQEARKHAVAALVGGPEIGHLAPTVPLAEAEEAFERFDGLFEEPRRYYAGLGLGDRRYVFQNGIAILSPTRAGVLGVVEND